MTDRIPCRLTGFMGYHRFDTPLTFQDTSGEVVHQASLREETLGKTKRALRRVVAEAEGLGYSIPEADVEKLIQDLERKARRLRRPRSRRLEKTLLDIGGRKVLFALWEFNLAALLKKGKVFDATSSRMRRLQPCSCHSNAASLWMRSKEKTKIVTGYALTEDGCWRQHSWGWDGRRVIETTCPRTMYYGYVLGRKDSFFFTLGNPPPVLLDRVKGDEDIIVHMCAMLAGKDYEVVAAELQAEWSDLGEVPPPTRSPL